MRNLTKDSAIRLLLLLSLFLVGAPAGVSPPARALVPNGIQASDYSVSTTESVPVTINVLANDSCLISGLQCPGGMRVQSVTQPSAGRAVRSEEHTSELQSQSNLVCRLLLEKKNTKLIHFQSNCLGDRPHRLVRAGRPLQYIAFYCHPPTRLVAHTHHLPYPLLLLCGTNHVH